MTADQAHKDVNELPKVLPFDSAIAYWMLLLSNSWFALYLKWWIEFLNKSPWTAQQVLTSVAAHLSPAQYNEVLEEFNLPV